MLDWKRFNTDQTIDFFKAEIAPLREHTSSTPVTTNFIGFNPTLDYWKFAREVDVVSLDSYPPLHDRPNDWLSGIYNSLSQNMQCSFKKKPFMQMECSPSVQNWKPVNKLKRPGLHKVEALQAIANGSDTVQYFQWRKSRGGCEKFHGVVVDHHPTEHTRVFQEVADVGRTLMRNLNLRKALGADLPDGVTAQIRTDGENEFIFVLGFNREPATVNLGKGRYTDLLTGEPVSGTMEMPRYSTRILTRA